eukprot:2952232-Prymnesium_polylepis.1
MIETAEKTQQVPRESCRLTGVTRSIANLWTGEPIATLGVGATPPLAGTIAAVCRGFEGVVAAPDESVVVRPRVASDPTANAATIAPNPKPCRASSGS